MSVLDCVVGTFVIVGSVTDKTVAIGSAEICSDEFDFDVIIELVCIATKSVSVVMGSVFESDSASASCASGRFTPSSSGAILSRVDMTPAREVA